MFLVAQTLEAAEEVTSFVGRALRHDKKVLLFSGVLTPEILKLPFSAVCLVCVHFMLAGMCGHRLRGLCGNWISSASAAKAELILLTLCHG